MNMEATCSSGTLVTTYKMTRYHNPDVYNLITYMQLCTITKFGLTVREEHRLKVFENRVLGRIFGAKRVDVTKDWRKAYNVELHNLYSSSNINKIIKSRG
jgi:hypothetical protein